METKFLNTVGFNFELEPWTERQIARRIVYDQRGCLRCYTTMRFRRYKLDYN